MRFSGALLVVATLLAPRLAAQVGPAPSGRCALDLSFDRPGTAIKLPSGQRNIYVGGNVVARCPAQRLVLKSDSLEYYGDEGRAFFIGKVDYTEPRLTLRSDFLTYFQREERILAASNVDAQLPSGSNLKGPQLEFWRAIPRVREQHATAVGRPTISLVEKDSAGRPQPPVTVTGNNVWMTGDSSVASQGEVVVVRPELTATGDSLYLDGGTGLLRMMRNPRVVGTRGRPFTLVGETIDVLSRERKLDRVLSKTKAEAVSRDVNLKSDTIDLRIANDVLQRALAWGKSRAHAVSASQSMLADSVDVLMPDQRLQEMHAVGDAFTEGAPDTVKFRTPERDRLTGDTIVAQFDTAASQVRDTTSKPKIRRLISTGNATSLQHLPPRDTSLRVPAIVYVVGSQITVNFDSGAVQRVEVKNEQLAAGIYLEPEDTTRAKRPADKGRPGTTPSGGARVLQRAPVSSTPAPQPPTTPNSPATPTAAPPRRR
jgi:lipopolysaccharide export system protein LptA